MFLAEELEFRLKAAFDPAELAITNDSHRHAGHTGDNGTGESHFSIRIRSASLAAMARVQRHRAVHAALGDLNQRIHAIALDLG